MALNLLSLVLGAMQHIAPVMSDDAIGAAAATWAPTAPLLLTMMPLVALSEVLLGLLF